jgi:hypothetical protein
MKKLTILFSLVMLLSGIKLNAQNIIYPPDLKTIIDVTKPPYNCDKTGFEDCTDALIRAMDDIVRPALEGQKAIEKEISEDPRTDFVHSSSVENRKREGKWQAIFPAELAPAKILYFPNGTYKVSNTVCYTFKDLHNSIGNELNRQIIIRGQSEAGTIIRLKDNCPGFEKGTNKPVFSFMLKEQSNVAMSNYFENITINVGRGNEGAAGLRFFANNTGAVRNVTIRSDDPDKKGSVGILQDKFNMSGSLFKNITVDGFDYGIQVLQNRIYCVFEHIRLSNQRVAGFLVNEMLVSIRDLQSDNTVPALLLTGHSGHVVLIDSELKRRTNNSGFNCGNDVENTAIECINGLLFARNVKTSGYNSAIATFGRQILPGGYIEEYSSHGVFTLFEGQVKKSLNLTIEETPEIPWDQEMSQWVSVNKYGATGDGKTDDTKAIQKALNSGKRNIYFQPGRYLINGQILVPKTVQRINYMFADLAAGENLRKLSNQGTFKVNEYSDSPLIIEDLFAFEQYTGEQYLVEHASKRTLVLSDIHTQIGAIYINSVSGGKVFIENICCTDQFPPNPNCYTFKGQNVWARQFNPERANPEVLNDSSRVWIFGVKIESKGTGFLTKNGGFTEVLGGTSNMGGEPPIINEGSNVSVVLGSTGWQPGDNPIIVEKRNGEERSIQRSSLPKRLIIRGMLNSYNEQWFIPLYVGYQK